MTSFPAAARYGDMAGLEKLVSVDATWSSDGGGKTSAALRPIEGHDKVVRFLVGGRERFLVGGRERFAAGLDHTVAEINGATALVAWRATRWSTSSRSRCATG